MRLNGPTHDSVPQAHQVIVRRCHCCPAVHIDLLDDAGEVFATANVQVEYIEPMVQAMRDAAREIEAEGGGS